MELHLVVMLSMTIQPDLTTLMNGLQLQMHTRMTPHIFVASMLILLQTMEGVQSWLSTIGLVQAVENDWKALILDPALSYTKLFNFFVQDKKEKPKVPKGGWPKRALGELLPYSCQNGLFP
jgi:hypothetical protein